MLTVSRIGLVILVFALAAPPLGTGIFLAVATVLSQGQSVGLAVADFVYSVSEFGLMSAVAGVVFASIAYLAIGRLHLLSHRAGRAILGISAMLLVFGSLVAYKLVVYGHFSGVLALIAFLASVAGAVIGATYPLRFLAAKYHNAG